MLVGSAATLSLMSALVLVSKDLGYARARPFREGRIVRQEN